MNNMKKMLYLHGLGGAGLNRELYPYFIANDIDVISPTVDHELFINNPFLFKTLQHLAQECDFIVGNSMGGYFAYHLGKATGKPTLCFNPAISDKTLSYNWFSKVTDYTPSEIQSNTLIFMGTEDEVVDHKAGMKFLSKENYDENFVKLIQGHGHQLPFGLMRREISKFANNDFEVNEYEEFV